MLPIIKGSLEPLIAVGYPAMTTEDFYESVRNAVFLKIKIKLIADLKIIPSHHQIFFFNAWQFFTLVEQIGENPSVEEVFRTFNDAYASDFNVVYLRILASGNMKVTNFF